PVRRIVELDPGPLEAVTDLGTNLRRVLADPAGEDESVRATYRGEVGPDVIGNAIAEHVDRKAGAAVIVLVRFREQVPHVVREAGDAEKARLLVQKIVHRGRR